MADTTTAWDMVDKRKSDLNAFYEQVDKTRKRLKAKTPFELLDFDGKTKIDDVKNVTENRSSTYYKRISSSLMSTKWQIVVDGVTKRESIKIEQFLERNHDQADEYMLREYGRAGLESFLWKHACHTALIGVHWMSFMDGDEYKIHCLPLDMRWTPWVNKEWVAPIFFRSKKDLIQDLKSYEEDALTNGWEFSKFDETKLKDVKNEVRYIWDEEFNELWVEKELVFRQPNIYGELPFVIVWVPSGYDFQDEDSLEFQALSILFGNEHLYDQLSQQLSIDATLGFNPVLPAYEKEKENISGGTSEPAPKRGESLDVLKGERHQLLPRPDVNNAQLASRDEISRLIDEGAPMAPRAYTSPPSAIEVTTEVELLDEQQNPQFIAVQMLLEGMDRLIIDQTIAVAKKEEKTSFMIGKRGKREEFNLTDLKDPDKYTISYQIMKQNKRLAVVNEARALAWWGKAPLKYILKDILSVQDPAGWERAIELEKAKNAFPALALAEMAVRYAEEAEELEDGVEKDLKIMQSKLLVHKYKMLLRMEMQPPVPGETENVRDATKDTGNANALTSLLGQGGPALPQLPGAQQGVTVE